MRRRDTLICLFICSLLLVSSAALSLGEPLREWIEQEISDGLLLKEEIHLFGDMLADLTQGNPRLAGLKGIDGYVYAVEGLSVERRTVHLDRLQKHFEEAGWRLVWRRATVARIPGQGSSMLAPLNQQTDADPQRMIEELQAKRDAMAKKYDEDWPQLKQLDLSLKALRAQLETLPPQSPERPLSAEQQKIEATIRKQLAAARLENVVLVLEEEGTQQGLCVMSFSMSELTALKLQGRVGLGGLEDLRDTMKLGWGMDLGLGDPRYRALPSPNTQPDQESPSSGESQSETKGQSRAQLEEIVEQGSQEPDVFLYLGMRYEEEQRHQDALQQYQRILREHPLVADWVEAHALHGQSRCLELLERYDEARNSYAEILRRYPDDDYYGVAAQVAVRRLKDLSPVQGTLEAQRLFNYADALLYNRGETEVAVNTYRAVVQAFPGSPYAPSAQAMIGYCSRWQDKDEHAAWLELRNMAPSDLAYYELGRSYAKLKDTGAAVEQLQKVVEVYPGSDLVPHAYYLIARSQDRGDQINAAILSYQYFLRTYGTTGGLAAEARISLERLKRGTERLPFLGVALRRDGRQVYVNRVLPGTGAEKAGLQPKDVIVGVGKIEIGSNPKEVTAAVITHEIGEDVTIHLLRNGIQREITATLGKRETD